MGSILPKKGISSQNCKKVNILSSAHSSQFRYTKFWLELTILIFKLDLPKEGIFSRKLKKLSYAIEFCIF